MTRDAERDIEKNYPLPDFIAKLRRLADALESGEKTKAPGKKTKTGAHATGADILEELAAQGHKLPQRVLDWRQLSKLKSTYTDALQLVASPLKLGATVARSSFTSCE